MIDSNPYPLPNNFGSKVNSFAPRYRVDNSRTTLKEFRNLSGRPIIGTIFWFLMKTGLVKLNHPVLDGPRPFRDDQCTIEDLHDPVRGHLLAVQDIALASGFFSPRYSVTNPAGFHGGAIRMLHVNCQMFLQILASSCGPFIEGHQLLISAAADSNDIFVSSNGRPSYNVLANMRTQRIAGAPFLKLFDSHEKMLEGLSNQILRFDSFDAVGTVMDYLATRFFEDKINRGIYLPEP